ncbi:hinge3 [Carabus blaptoides fortunei]
MLTSANGTQSSPVSVQPLNASLLISEVHGRRPIWDKKHELHNQRDLIEALWNEISVTVGVPVSRARAKWKNLKDSFRREAKRAFTELHYRPRWRLYQSLMFLYDQQLEFDQKEDTMQPGGFLEPDQTPSKVEYEFDHVQANSASGGSEARQLEQTNADNYEPEQQMRADLHADDADMCFFRSLVPHMKELTPQKRMQLRIKIHEMVYKEVYADNNP